MGITSLDLTITGYLTETRKALRVWDVMQGVIKCVVFALAIGLIACQQGLATTGGAEGVGRRTTSSVVTRALHAHPRRRRVHHALPRVPPMSAPLITAYRSHHGLGGDVILLEHASFEVERGEVFAILGGSGCGKSTLLRHLIGLDEPMGGSHPHRGRGRAHASRSGGRRSA